jgi:hypothetical protein
MGNRIYPDRMTPEFKLSSEDDARREAEMELLF